LCDFKTTQLLTKKYVKIKIYVIGRAQYSLFSLLHFMQ
jgi:hypothetical protein